MTSRQLKIAQKSTAPKATPGEVHDDPGWKHPAELIYSTGKYWTDKKIFNYCIANALSVGPYSLNSPDLCYVTDGRKSVVLSEKYRLPIIYASWWQWTKLKSLLTAEEEKRKRRWPEEKYEVLHIARVWKILTDEGPSGDSMSSSYDMQQRVNGIRNWRCHTLDRVLTRFRMGYFSSEPSVVEKFWNQYQETEYSKDTLEFDWRSWLSEPRDGVQLSETETSKGLEPERLMRGLKENHGTFIWETEGNPSSEGTPAWSIRESAISLFSRPTKTTTTSKSHSTSSVSPSPNSKALSLSSSSAKAASSQTPPRVRRAHNSVSASANVNGGSAESSSTPSVSAPPNRNLLKSSLLAQSTSSSVASDQAVTVNTTSTNEPVPPATKDSPKFSHAQPKVESQSRPSTPAGSVDSPHKLSLSNKKPSVQMSVTVPLVAPSPIVVPPHRQKQRKSELGMRPPSAASSPSTPSSANVNAIGANESISAALAAQRFRSSMGGPLSSASPIPTPAATPTPTPTLAEAKVKTSSTPVPESSSTGILATTNPSTQFLPSPTVSATSETSSASVPTTSTPASALTSGFKITIPPTNPGTTAPTTGTTTSRSTATSSLPNTRMSLQQTGTSGDGGSLSISMPKRTRSGSGSGSTPSVPRSPVSPPPTFVIPANPSGAGINGNNGTNHTARSASPNPNAVGVSASASSSLSGSGSGNGGKKSDGVTPKHQKFLSAIRNTNGHSSGKPASPTSTTASPSATRSNAGSSTIPLNQKLQGATTPSTSARTKSPTPSLSDPNSNNSNSTPTSMSIPAATSSQVSTSTPTSAHASVPTPKPTPKTTPASTPVPAPLQLDTVELRLAVPKSPTSPDVSIPGLNVNNGARKANVSTAAASVSSPSARMSPSSNIKRPGSPLEKPGPSKVTLRHVAPALSSREAEKEREREEDDDMNVEIPGLNNYCRSPAISSSANSSAKVLNAVVSSASNSKTDANGKGASKGSNITITAPSQRRDQSQSRKASATPTPMRLDPTSKSRESNGHDHDNDYIMAKSESMQSALKVDASSSASSLVTHGDGKGGNIESAGLPLHSLVHLLSPALGPLHPLAHLLEPSGRSSSTTT